MLFEAGLIWQVGCSNDLLSCLRTVDSASTQVAHLKRFGRLSVPFVARISNGDASHGRSNRARYVILLYIQRQAGIKAGPCDGT